MVLVPEIFVFMAGSIFLYAIFKNKSQNDTTLKKTRNFIIFILNIFCHQFFLNAEAIVSELDKAGPNATQGHQDWQACLLPVDSQAVQPRQTLQFYGGGDDGAGLQTQP